MGKGLSTSFSDVREQLAKNAGGSVDLHKDDDMGTAVITLNNHEKKNAVSGKMMVDLADIISDLETWERGTGVILHGATGTFCSGADLDTVRNHLDPWDGLKLSMFMQDCLTRLLQLPMVSISLIEGKALGGGAELITATDFRLVTETARIGFVQMRMGLTTGWGGGTRLVQLVGRRKALELFGTGNILDYNTSLKIGLADDLVHGGELALQRTKEWLASRTQGHIEGVRAMKVLVSNAATLDVASSLLAERNIFGKMWGKPAHIEAMTSKIKHK